jgi:hypothetical protein
VVARRSDATTTEAERVRVTTPVRNSSFGLRLAVQLTFEICFLVATLLMCSEIARSIKECMEIPSIFAYFSARIRNSAGSVISY